MQTYFLSIIYLIFTAFLLLIDSYRDYLLFMIKIRQILLANKRLKLLLFIAGIILTLLQLFFPIYPGPRFLGDLIPAILTLLATMYYVNLKEERISEATLYFKGKRRGLILLTFAIIHFVFPSCVLL